MSILEKINSSCEDKIWWIRVPITLVLIYWGYKYSTLISYESVFFGLNLGIHEMGHFLFFLDNRIFICCRWDNLTAVCTSALNIYVLSSSFYAISISLFWISTNLYNIATYLGDARSQILPLVRLGVSDPKHDWHYLLNELHLITSDKIIVRRFELLLFS